jgi:hypothetical protein
LVLKVSGAEMAILPTAKNTFFSIQGYLIADFGSRKISPNQSH